MKKTFLVRIEFSLDGAHPIEDDIGLAVGDFVTDYELVIDEDRLPMDSWTWEVEEL